MIRWLSAVRTRELSTSGALLATEGEALALIVQWNAPSMTIRSPSRSPSSSTRLSPRSSPRLTVCSR